jgi:putative transposase
LLALILLKPHLVCYKVDKALVANERYGIRDFKSYTSREVRKSLEDKTNIESRREWLIWMFERAGKNNIRNHDFQFWQQHNHPIELSTNKMIDQRLDYIHNNPIEAGFVFKCDDWVWSSARQYSGELGEIELSYL